MLNDRARVILFWFTVGMMILVAVVAVVTILRACGGPVSNEPALTVSPAEVSLCGGEQHQFTAGGEGEITWEATGGTISGSGLFLAGDTPGDYTVSVTRNGSRRKAEAIVHVVACTPTPTPVPSPTPAPTPTPTPEPTAIPPADPQGDVAPTKVEPGSSRSQRAWTSAPPA